MSSERSGSTGHELPRSGSPVLHQYVPYHYFHTTPNYKWPRV